MIIVPSYIGLLKINLCLEVLFRSLVLPVEDLLRHSSSQFINIGQITQYVMINCTLAD